MKGKLVKSVKMVFKNGNDYEAGCEIGLDKGEVVDWVERVFRLEQPKPKPLIKSVKVRKFVRDWAEHWGIDKVVIRYVDNARLDLIGFPDSNGTGREIDIQRAAVMDEIKYSHRYTITELCGEDE